MEKQLYIVYFESANYAGYGQHCLVWATNVDDAMSNDLVNQYAEEVYYEQDQDQYTEEHGDSDGVSWAAVLNAELLAGSQHEKFVKKQPQFYPIVNKP